MPTSRAGLYIDGAVVEIAPCFESQDGNDTDPWTIEHLFVYIPRVRLEDNPLDPHSIELLRRSVAMLSPGQMAPIERDRALVLLESLQELQRQRKDVIVELRGLLERLQGVG